MYNLKHFQQGCRCDNIGHFYTLSTDLKSDWTETCPTQPDILSYIKDVIHKHRLEPYIILNTKVVLAEWLSEAQAYKVTTEDTKGNRSTLTANVIVSATGLLHVPRMPTIPGIESFRGKLFHSAKWDTSVDLTEKNIHFLTYLLLGMEAPGWYRTIFITWSHDTRPNLEPKSWPRYLR